VVREPLSRGHLVWVEPVSGTVIDPPRQKHTATKPVSTSVCGEAELGFILRCLRRGHQALRLISTGAPPPLGAEAQHLDIVSGGL
jgi:hypothetical protein